jgi:cytidylate kinase
VLKTKFISEVLIESFLFKLQSLGIPYLYNMNSMRKNIVIAVDGHSSCGKSTMAKQIAKALGILYVDSGAMYRAVTWFFMQYFDLSDSSLSDEELIRLLPKISIDFERKNDKDFTILNGKNIESDIRQMAVSEKVSRVSAIPKVREKLVKIQRDLAKNHSVIMDGRDIGTIVFPKADVKLFVTADAKTRAERRYLELQSKGESADFDLVLQNIIARDEMDSTRKASPLKQAEDAILIDNSNMNQEAQLAFALKLIKEKLK